MAMLYRSVRGQYTEALLRTMRNEALVIVCSVTRHPQWLAARGGAPGHSYWRLGDRLPRVLAFFSALEHFCKLRAVEPA